MDREIPIYNHVIVRKIHQKNMKIHYDKLKMIKVSNILKIRIQEISIQIYHLLLSAKITPKNTSLTNKRRLISKKAIWSFFIRWQVSSKERILAIKMTKIY